MLTTAAFLQEVPKKKSAGAKQQQKGQKRKGCPADNAGQEYGVTRGIDFKGVCTVVNMDLPQTLSG